MKKKIVFLIISLFVLTGCSATYDIEIYNNTVKEDFVYENLLSDTWDDQVKYGLTYRELVLSSYDYPYPVFDSTTVDEDDTIKIAGVEYYDNRLINNANSLGQKLSYHKFNLSNFNDSSLIKKCYQYFNIIEEENKIILSTSLDNLCFDEYPILDEITVNLKTNHKVISSNADKVNGYHYTWNINRDNKNDAAIQITLEANKYIFNYENEILKKIVYIGLIVGIIVGVGGITYLHFKNKNNRLNEI